MPYSILRAAVLGKAEFLSNAEAVALFEGLQQDESSMLP